MARRDDPGQIDLFADQPAATPVPATPDKPPVSGFGGTPDLLPQVLHDIHRYCYGTLRPNGRIVWLDGDGHFRHAADDVASVIESLMTQRYAHEGEFLMVKQGAVWRSVDMVALTPSGDKMRRRWFSLAGVR